MKTVLCVEDELKILRSHKRFFTDNGYNVLTAGTAAEAREQLAAHTPDAILLDIMLPDGNGLDILQELRAAGNKTPIIILTAWGKPQDISRGYKLGATAYLSKPFDYEAVLAVLEGIFGTEARLPEQITKGGLRLNVLSGQAFLNEQDLLLTPKEYALLALFVEQEGQTLGAKYLYEHVWGQPMLDSDVALRKQLSNLRKKLTGSGYAITKIRSEGYRFTPK
jgi:DNA-binding response OmpR family regulator